MLSCIKLLADNNDLVEAWFYVLLGKVDVNFAYSHDENLCVRVCFITKMWHIQCVNWMIEANTYKFSTIDLSNLDSKY